MEWKLLNVPHFCDVWAFALHLLHTNDIHLMEINSYSLIIVKYT